MMSEDATEKTQVLCGKCGSKVTGPSEPKADDLISCSNVSCDNSDTYENVRSACQQYLTDQAGRTLQKQMKGMERKGKVLSISYSGSDIPDRDYKFILQGV